MPDVKGLMNDPEFQKLPMGTQKTTLGQLDPEFSTLSDGDFVKFRAGMVKKEEPLSLGGVGRAFVKQGIGGAKRLAGDAYSGLQLSERFLSGGGVNLPDLPQSTRSHGKEEETGSTLMGIGEVVPAIVGGGEALAGMMAARAASKGASSAAEAIASKIPKIHPFAKFLAKRIPGVGTAIDILEAAKSQLGPALEGLPKAGRDELAFQLHKETTGKLPETASEKVTAIRNLREALKTLKVKGAKAEGVIYDEQGKPFAKKGTAAKGDTPMEDIAPPAAPSTPALGAKIGKQYPKQAPPGDMRRQVFVNLKTALKGEGGGTVTATENKAFRALVEKTYGKRVSAMTDAELDQVNRDITKLAEQMRAGAN